MSFYFGTVLQRHGYTLLALYTSCSRLPVLVLRVTTLESVDRQNADKTCGCTCQSARSLSTYAPKLQFLLARLISLLFWDRLHFLLNKLYACINQIILVICSNNQIILLARDIAKTNHSIIFEVQRTKRDFCANCGQRRP